MFKLRWNFWNECTQYFLGNPTATTEF